MPSNMIKIPLYFAFFDNVDRKTKIANKKPKIGTFGCII
jgi:hypothetical protein